MKKFLCMLLAALMLLSLAACGTGDDSVESEKATGTKAEESATENPTDNSLVCDLPDLNYGGDTVSIIYAKNSGREDELFSEGSGSGNVSDAVYERNQTVMDQLNVKFNLIGESGDQIATKVDTDIKSSSGEPEYDIVVNGTYMAITPAIEGKYKNLTALRNIDTSKTYWTQGYNDLATFTTENRQFLASGPIAISMFRFMFLTIYNKTVMDNNKKPDLYDTVMNGDWTLDYQYELINGMYVDADGNSKRSEDDAYGFITGDIISMDPYMVSTDIHLIVKNADTKLLEFNADAQQSLVSAVDAVQKLVNSDGSYVFSTAEKDDVGKDNIVQMFAKNKSMMATIMFWNMEHNIDELAGLSYGIAPIPKLTKSAEYKSYVQDQVSSFGISAGIGSEDRAEELAAVLEAMAYHSYNIVRPAYYTNTLSTRYMQDPQSEEILNLIFKSLSFDFSQTCSNILSGNVLRDQLRPVMSARKNTVASKMRSWSRSVPNALTKINDALESMDTDS